jgi:hypothetical protein
MILPGRKKIITSIVIVILLVGFIYIATLLWNHFVSQKIVTLDPSPGTTISLGTPGSDSLNIKNNLMVATSKTSKRIPARSYVVSFSGEGLQTLSRVVDVTKNILISSPDLNYTQAKLDADLVVERSTIHKTVMAAIGNGYSIKNEELYVKSNWYSALLAPANSNNDTLRIILNKENSQWKVAAKPSIIFWIDDYQSIPQEIIRDINAKGF